VDLKVSVPSTTPQLTSSLQRSGISIPSIQKLIYELDTPANAI